MKTCWVDRRRDGVVNDDRSLFKGVENNGPALRRNKRFAYN